MRIFHLLGRIFVGCAAWCLARLVRLFLIWAVCTVVIALFFNVENWRGRQAWNHARKSWQASGVAIDWTNYIPIAVPDAENFFAASNMQRWFTGKAETDLSKTLVYAGFNNPSNAAQVTVAEIIIGSDGMATPSNTVAFEWSDKNADAEIARLLTNAIGPSVIIPSGIAVMARMPSEVRPARILLKRDPAPTPDEMQTFLPNFTLGTSDFANAVRPQIEAEGANNYRLTVAWNNEAADFLRWCKHLDPQFSAVEEASQRRSAQISGDYFDPYNMPRANLSTVKPFFLVLAARAECHLLLGQPEDALKDLTIINDFGHLWGKCRPTRLVSALIYAASAQTYANVVAEGMRLHAWREAQLPVLEEQLGGIDLLPPVREAWATEAAWTCFMMEEIPQRHLANGQPISKLMPIGWLDQNKVVAANFYSNVIASIDPTAHMMYPERIDAANTMCRGLSKSPYHFLALVSLANQARAALTTARGQTIVNEARLACALERWRLSNGDYPETLAALIPKFIDRIPHDVIGGQLLRYHRLANNKFILYSIGWDQVDDGGIRGSSDYVGDWTWPIWNY